MAYETVAAGQTGQVLGASAVGSKDTFLTRLVIIPATTSPGAVTLIDGATSIPVFVGGTTTVAPIYVDIGTESQSGAWSITTGANVSVMAIGNF